jgi:hypothetical protein
VAYARAAAAASAPASTLLHRHRLVLGVTRLWLILRHPLMHARFMRKMGYFPNPALPSSYAEKIMWRKIFDRNPDFVTFTDKLAAKDFVAARAPGLPVPRTLWDGIRIEDVPEELLAGDVVIKSNNDCGSNIIIRQGNPAPADLLSRTREMMRIRKRKEEWAYGPVEPRLFIEEWLPLDHHGVPSDVKVYVAGGKVANIWMADKLEGQSLTLDAAGNFAPGRDSGYPRADQALPYSAASTLLGREAAGLAEAIAGDSDFLRVDFLVSEGRLFAGELTVYSSSGYERLANPGLEAELTAAWDLRRSHFLRTAHRGLARVYAEALAAAETLRRGG